MGPGCPRYIPRDGGKTMERRTHSGILAVAAGALIVYGTGNLWDTVAAGAVAGLLWLLCRRELRGGKIFWAIQWLAALFIGAQILRYVPGCWELEREGSLIIPWGLLALAACTNGDGEKLARIGGILLGISILLYGGILAAGLTDLHPLRLTAPEKMGNPCLLLGFLLMVAGKWLWGRKSGGTMGWMLVFGLALSAWVTAILGDALGMQDFAVYQAVRGLRFLSVGERFEAVLSVTVTLGWFAALSVLLAIGKKASRQVTGRGDVWVLAILMGVFYLIPGVPVQYAVGAGLLAWGVLPILVSTGEFLKKRKNSEKKG